MSQIFNRLLNKPWLISILAGVSVFAAFERISLVPSILLFPVFCNHLIRISKNIQQAFVLGFFTSFIIMLGGFYWVTYVIHEFGNLSWFLSVLLFLGFCGFGALNFPLFTTLAFWIQTKLDGPSRKNWQPLWYALGLPALFTCTEFFIPKLFPWFLGHSLYRELTLIQICEFTGASFLTFSIYSLGGTLGLFLGPFKLSEPPSRKLLLIPILLLAIQITFGVWTRGFRIFPAGQDLRVALIQANIGNLDKVAAYSGSLSRVDYVMNTYQSLTEQSLNQKPDLVVWPETAVPFRLDLTAQRATDLRSFVRKIGVPLITGGYSTSPTDWRREYNAAFLLSPEANDIRQEIYQKNILLAFGEYLPLGDTFPKLYEWFPQVSDFQRGSNQKKFLLGNTQLGISICYESIVPSFMRKVAQQQIHAFLNLTNDSWFGPTSEPYLHAALTVFRTIEHRVPLIRVTNTGTSFVVDHLGQMSKRTKVYQPDILVETLTLPKQPPQTFYGRYGDWFIYLLVFFLVGFILKLRKHRAPLSV